MLPTTSTGSPCVKSIPLNAKAYWPVPTVLVVRDAEEYRTVTVDVPELAPAAALIVTVPTGGATQSPNSVPFTLQMTPALGVAAKDCRPPAGMVSAAGFTTKAGAATTVTVLVPVFCPDVAVMVTEPA